MNSNQTFTPGPLFVRPSASVHFRIETVNEKGEVLFTRDLPCHSSEDKSFQDALECKNFPPPFSRKAKPDYNSEYCSALNQRALADEVLRAAAPDLFALTENLLTILAYPHGSEAQIRCLEEVAQDARAILAKVKGAQS